MSIHSSAALSAVSTASSGFDPADAGTPESGWNVVLQDTPRLSMNWPEILVVGPHPDDEVLGAGGLIRKAAQSGSRVSVMSVTDGEAAYPDWRELAQIRRREVRDALVVLTPQLATLQQLSIPDGRVREHRAVLLDAIEQRVSRDTLLVAPFERDGHPDHDATGEVCIEIARVHGITLWRYPIWLWHHGSPDRYAASRWGRFMLDAGTVEAKARAVSCFASQIRPLAREPIVPNHVLCHFRRRYEAFLL